MIKHDIAGGWVLLREDNEVTERGRREVRRIMFRLAELPGMQAAFSLAEGAQSREELEKAVTEQSEDLVLALGDGMGLMDELQDATIMCRVKSWSFTDEDSVELPVAVDSLLDLPGDAYDVLKELCKDLPTGLDLEPSPDPKAPTSSTTG